MPHIPKWPPDIYDWLPGDPTKLQPPLPNFSWNPSWLTQEQFAQLEEETSTWAARRAEAMVGPRAGFEVARRAAHSMLAPYLSRLPPLPEELAREEKKRRVRKPREERAAAGVLTTEQEEKLTRNALEDIIDYRKRHRGAAQTTEEKIELAKVVVAWAEHDYGVIITEAKGAEIVDKAIARFAPARA